MLSATCANVVKLLFCLQDSGVDVGDGHHHKLPMKVIHKEQDSVTAFCSNSVRFYNHFVSCIFGFTAIVDSYKM